MQEGLARALLAEAGAQGIWQPTTSSERDSPDRLSGHKTLLYSMNRAAGWIGGSRREAAGTQQPGVLRSGCRCWGGIEYNSSCVWKPVASFMTVPNEASPSCARADLLSWVALSSRMEERSGLWRRG